MEINDNTEDLRYTKKEDVISMDANPITKIIEQEENDNNESMNE